MNTLPIVSSSRSRRRNALREALSMFKEEWICDHLLGKAPITDATIISSPLQQLHAASYESDMIIDADNEPVGESIGSFMSTEAMIVPAYSRDGLNLGFCLAECAGLSPDNFIECHYGPTVRNFVFREDNGLYVALAQQSENELFTVLIPGKKREMSYFCFSFRGKSFSALIKKGVHDPIAFEQILHANSYTNYVRQCPHCSASIGASCDCDFPFSASKTPLDLSAVIKNISVTQLGNGAGSCLFEVFSDGVLKVSIPAYAKNKTKHIAKHGRTKRFITRAIADLLKNTPGEVQRRISSPLNDDDDVLINTEQIDLISDPEDFLQEIVALSTIDEAFHESLDNQISLDLPYHTLQLPNQAIEHNVTDQSIHATINMQISVSEEGMPTPTWPLTMVKESISSHLTNFEKIAPVSQNEPSIAFSTKFVPGAVDASRHKLPRARPIAPRNAAPINHIVQQVSEETKIKKLAEEVRAWRAYQRKIRNRASARRSNLVRKQRNELARRNQ